LKNTAALPLRPCPGSREYGMYPVSIHDSKVSLRELEEGDAEGLLKVYGNVDTTMHLSFEPRSLEQVTDIIKGAIDAATEDPRGVYMLAVATATERELVGAARLALGEHQSGQIGFALRPDHWGQGKGTETVELLLTLGFDQLGLHRIWGARSPVNQASARTMLRVGMIEEGTMRGHLFTRGAWRDSVVHSILSDERRSG
jgi:[ribosomal protein S5]-alanine N-acetyltransferase